MCLEHDLGRERVEEREIWDEDDVEVEDVFVSMVEESSSRRSNKIIQITNDTASTRSAALIPVGRERVEEREIWDEDDVEVEDVSRCYRHRSDNSPCW